MKIPMKSISYAMRAKQLLNEAKIQATIGKATGESGCYYYLKISDRYYHAAMAILNKADLL